MNLQTKLTNIKYTTKQYELFTKIKLETIDDLLTFYPARYLDINETPLLDGDVVIEAKIATRINNMFFQGKKSRIYFDIIYQDKSIKVSIFNQFYLMKNLNDADIITIIGKYDSRLNSITVKEVKFKELSSIKGIYPIYHLKNSYKNNDYYKVIAKALKDNYQDISNRIPHYLIEKYNLYNRNDALMMIHFPKNNNELKRANSSIIYEEFFMFAMKNIMIVANDSFVKSAKEIDMQLISNVVNEIGYELTADQKLVLNEIYLNLKNSSKMNRLLLADVGSGKTLVALISAYMVYLSGYQVAFMAPTTILALQHFHSAIEIFKNVEFNISYLSSSTNALEREHLIDDLKRGKIDLLIGTHALIQDDVLFKNLGLAIFDEQQRFGVLQRRTLINKGSEVETLMLSATPIPRTLAQVYYNNISVSYMKETLPFKKPIISHYFKSKTIKPFYEELITLLNNNVQVYVVTPLVEESENQSTKNVNEVYASISNHFKDKYTVGLLHGKMNSDEKENTMQAFVEGNIQILVATSLIEVGISVSNANCIIIYDAHNFGLSQLHQLRGRVGRGAIQGHCVFLSDSKDDSNIEKLDFINHCNDGFAIAQYDLETRGPGDMFGSRQSGLPSFNLANLVKDEKIYQLAAKDAAKLYEDKDTFNVWYEDNKEYLENLERSDY